MWTPPSTVLRGLATQWLRIGDSMATERRPTVFLVINDPDVLRGLADLLRSVRLPVSAFTSVGEFFRVVGLKEEGCLLADTHLPDVDGISFQQRLTDEGYLLPVIFISDSHEVPLAVRAMQNGAVDFLEKPVNHQEILDTIQHALQTNARRRAWQARHLSVAQRLGRLSPRENQVMTQLVDGRNNREVALDLGISIKTVETHRANILTKTGCNTLAQLVRLVLADQLGHLDPLV